MPVIKLIRTFALLFCLVDSVVVEEDSVTSVMEVSEWEHLQSLLTKAQKVYAYESNEKPSLTLASTTCGSDCSHGIVKQVDKSSSASFRSGLKSRSGSHSRAKLSQTESKSKTVSHCKSKTNVNNKPSESGLRKTAKHPKVLDALGVSVHCQVGVKHSSLRLDSVSRSHPSDRTHSGSGGKASKCKFTRTQEPKTQQGFSIQQNGWVKYDYNYMSSFFQCFFVLFLLHLLFQHSTLNAFKILSTPKINLQVREMLSVLSSCQLLSFTSVP